MSTQQDPALEEMLAAIQAWFDAELARGSLDATVRRTTLQAGVFNDILLDYQPGRTSVDVDLGIGGDTPSSQRPVLTEPQVRGTIVPALAAAVRHRLDALGDSALIDYRFSFRAVIPTMQGRLQLTVCEYLNEAKRQDLLMRIHAYVDQKLTHGRHPTKELDTFFLTRHLLDPQLFPAMDVAWTIAQLRRIEELNKGRPRALDEHRSHIIQFGVKWVENHFLPQYYEVQKSVYRSNEYTLKPGAALEPSGAAVQGVDLLLYIAVMVLRYEPSFSKPTGRLFLELATQLGSRRAALMLKEGSGAYALEQRQLRTAQLMCSANDVFALVNIAILEEGAAAYGQALDLITRLLRLGFPKSYKIKLKSAARNFLPIKGLAKSDTQRFFANALAYPSLWPELEEYARAAIAEFEFYADTDGEKNCMPGSYACFGLALADPRHFPLTAYYMDHVDVEHQSVQDGFTAAFALHYGVSAESLPTLVACLRRCTDAVKLKLASAFEIESMLSLLWQQLQGLESHEVETVLHGIWGAHEKLAALVRKASGTRRELLQNLLMASS